MPYSLTPNTTDVRPWLDDLRRSVCREQFVATCGGWDEERHSRHLAKTWEHGIFRAVNLYERLGFEHVASGPFVRSRYSARQIVPQDSRGGPEGVDGPPAGPWTRSECAE